MRVQFANGTSAALEPRAEGEPGRMNSLFIPEKNRKFNRWAWVLLWRKRQGG
jgi:hypothetical protein